MLECTQTRYLYPHAAKKDQTHGWVLIRTDVTFGDGRVEIIYGKHNEILDIFKREPFIGVMTEPYDTAEHALDRQRHCGDGVTVAYAKIIRKKERKNV